MSDQWRQLALEVVVTMSETAPATVRKAGKFITLLGGFVSAVLFISCTGNNSTCSALKY